MNAVHMQLQAETLFADLDIRVFVLLIFVRYTRKCSCYAACVSALLWVFALAAVILFYVRLSAKGTFRAFTTE